VIDDYLRLTADRATLAGAYDELERKDLLEVWRANPLCLRCGLTGDQTVSLTAEGPGALCFLHAVELKPSLRSPGRFAAWLEAGVNRLRGARRRRGRPAGPRSGNAGGISDKAFPDRHDAVVKSLRSLGLVVSDGFFQAVATDLGMSAITLKRRREKLGVLPPSPKD